MKSSRGIYNIYLVFCSCVYILLYSIDTTWCEYIAFSIFAFTLITFFYVQRRSKEVAVKNWLSPSNFLLLGLIIVNLQTLLNVLLGYGSLRLYLGPASFDSVKSQVFYYSLIGFNCYFLGVLNFNICALKHQPKGTKSIKLKPWAWLTCMAFLYFLANIDVNSFMTGLAYKGSGAYNRIRESSEFVENLLNVFLSIYLAIYAYNNVLQDKRHNLKSYLLGISVVFWVPFILYIILRAMSGDRGPVIYNALLLFYSYVISCQPRIKLIWVIIAVIAGASMVSALGIARGLAAEKSFDEKLSEAFEMTDKGKASVLSATQELANSVNCNFIAVHDIESGKTDYRYGANTLYNISTAIPGSYSIYRNVFGIDPSKYSTSEYLTISLQGYRYRYGLGMSTFSEFYLDGGLIGIILGFFILGILFRFVDDVVSNTKLYSIYIVIFALKLASICIYIPRSSMGYGISKALYCVIIFFVLNLVFSRFKNLR